MSAYILLSVTLLVMAAPLQARIRRVPQDLPTLQAAVDTSLAHGDTVLVDRGVWTEQVHIGPGRLTLASNYLFSGDTLDIEETILDGGLQRNILFAEMDTQSELTISGLTFRRALSVYDLGSDHVTGGALHFETCPGRVRLAHVVFRDNRDRMGGSAVWFAGAYFPWNIARFELEDINAFDNHDQRGPAYGSDAIIISHPSTINAKRLFTSGATVAGTTQYILHARDTCRVEEARFVGIMNMLEPPLYVSVGQYGHLDIRDVYFTHNHATHPGSLQFGVGPQGRMRLRNIHVEDNFYEDRWDVDEASIGPELTILADQSTMDADSLFLNRNRVEYGGGLLYARSPMPATRGWIRHLEVVGNHVGSRDGHVLDSDYHADTPIRIVDISLEDAVFRDNILETPYLGPGEYSRMGHLLWVQTEAGDSLTVRNVLIENLEHIDNDQYRPEDAAQPEGIRNAARGLGVTYAPTEIYPMRHLEVDSVVVRNSRVNLILPEIDISDMFQDYYVSSTLGIGSSNGSSEFLPITSIHNITLDGCDDGGLVISLPGIEVEIDDVSVLNTQRRGLLLIHSLLDVDTRLRVRNVLLKNIQQEEFHRAWPYPLRIVEQSALLMGLYRDPAHVHDFTFSNFSILDCDVPILLQVLDESSQQDPYVIHNSLIAGNTYDFLTPWWPEFAPTHFQHCAVQEAVEGEDNLIVDDPGFDPVLGSPWLAEDSPCVDAGDPSRLYDDREDPGQPGLALWPGRGTTRNDIGYTGGPGIRPTEYLVSVPPPSSPASPERPAALVLHPAAPNPFNPVTTLSFTLERPGRTRLDLYDLRGACVRHLDERARGRGAHTFTLDATGLPSGVYIVELRQGRELTQQKVLLLK